MKKLLLAGGVLLGALLATVGVVAYGGSKGQAAAKDPKCTGYYALTFDDGPTPATPKLLSTLKRLGVRATFFVTGQHALENPKLIAAIVAGGHEIGDHSWNHVELPALAGTDKLTGADGEIGGTAGYLEHAESVPTLKWFRPPYGKTDDAVRAAAASFGLTEVLWTVDTSDWDKRPASQIIETALTVKPGGTILMHDSPYTHTIEALPKVVAGLRAKGLCAGRIVPSTTPVVAWPGATFTTTAAAW
jgi:peptidoglycan/xylan/chitin deacetylase (PgdA/CDA1 family)